MKRNGTLDLMKLIYIIPIVLVHSNSLVSHAYDWKTDSIICGGGYITVEFFFIVSGLLMAMKAEQCINKHGELMISSATLDFTYRKFLNLFPYFVLPFIVGFIFIYQNSPKSVIIEDALYSIFTILQINIGGFGASLVVGPSWYVSAMLVTGMIIYPVLLKYGQYFSRVLAPVISVLIFGYIAQTRGNISAATIWLGVIYNGLLRAIAGMSLGCTCYQLSKKLKENSLTTLGTIVITLIEIVCYGLPLILMWMYKYSKVDFVMVIMFAVAITISFSNKSGIAKVLNKEKKYLANLSMSLYLSHAPMINVVKHFTPAMDRWERLPLYLVACFIFGVVNAIFAWTIKKLWNAEKGKFKALFVK